MTILITDFNRKYKSQSTLKSHLVFPCVTKKLEYSAVVLAMFVCACVSVYFTISTHRVAGSMRVLYVCFTLFKYHFYSKLEPSFTPTKINECKHGYLSELSAS